MFKVFDEIGINQSEYNYNGQLNVITFWNGSQIFLIDTAYKPSDPLYTRFGGYELTGCAVDESAETDYKAIEILSTRIGRRGNHEHGIKAKFLETFNPSKNHVYNRYYKPMRDGNMSEDYIFIPALPTDNPSPEVKPYIERILKTADTITIERLIHGSFEYDDSPDKLINYDSILDLFDNTHVEGGANFITADIARLGSDKAVIMVWSGMRVVEVVEFAKSKLTELRDKMFDLKNKYKIPNSQIIADEDGVGGGVVDFMRIRGFVNGSKCLNGENYANLKTQCYYKLAEAVNKSQIYIENCTSEQRQSIIQELEQVRSYKIDQDGKIRMMPKEKVKELIGRSPDFSDCLMMRLFFTLFKVAKPFSKVL